MLGRQEEVAYAAWTANMACFELQQRLL